MKESYDLIFSLGSTCSCSQALRHAGLQFLSLPFDWIGGPSVLEKSRRICESFDGWFARDSFELVTVPRYGRETYWRDRWGFTPIHDLNTSVPLEDQLPAVREKYARRTQRLLELIGRSRRVLAVQIDDPLFAPTDRADAGRCQALLAAKWPDKEFHLLLLKNEEGVSPSSPKTSVGEGWTEVSFGYLRRGERSIDVADYRLIGDWLATQYDVADYRTSEERRQADRKRRQAEYAKMGAKSFWGYHWSKVQYKLYKHLKKDLEKRGIV